MIGYKRSKARSDFAGSATYGYCASRKMHYYGYKLVTLTTLTGLPLVYELVPAHTDERVAAETVSARVHDCDILGDKGFIGDDWQWLIIQETHNRVWTFKRRNQKLPNPPIVDYFLKRFRCQIETTFHILQNTGRHLERLLARSVIGLSTRVAAKMTTFVLTILLRQCHNIDIRTFESIYFTFCVSSIPDAHLASPQFGVSSKPVVSTPTKLIHSNDPIFQPPIQYPH